MGISPSCELGSRSERGVCERRATVFRPDFAGFPAACRRPGVRESARRCGPPHVASDAIAAPDATAAADGDCRLRPVREEAAVAAEPLRLDALAAPLVGVGI